MITIGICDDDRGFIEELRDYLHDTMKYICDWQARIYTCGEEILADINNHTFDCNLLFMDIYMQGMSGVEIARYFYEHHIDTDIIFLTSSKDHVYECYHYHSFSYLLKPIAASDVANEIQRYMNEVSKAPKSLNISIKNAHYRIPLRSITYLESDCRKVIVHTPQKNYEYYDKLDHLETALAPYGFIRCHQSFLIPDSKITSYQSGQITIGDCVIPVSTRYREQIEQLFAENVHPPLHASNPMISQSLSLNRGITGALVCTKGTYLGSIIRFYADENILIGRDGNTCDIVMNLPRISRKHCTITYHASSNSYEVVDTSRNGTFVMDSDNSPLNHNCEPQRITANEPYFLKPGSTLCFGDCDTIYQLI